MVIVVVDVVVMVKMVVDVVGGDVGELEEEVEMVVGWWKWRR